MAAQACIGSCGSRTYHPCQPSSSGTVAGGGSLPLPPPPPPEIGRRLRAQLPCRHATQMGHGAAFSRQRRGATPAAAAAARRGAGSTQLRSVAAAAAKSPSQQPAAAAQVDIAVETGPRNSRCIWAGVDIGAPAPAVYSALTAYEQLDTFIPGLTENRCLERYSDGCRLLQVGQQDIALGLKFSARVCLRIQEHPRGMPQRLLSRSPNFRSVRSSGGRSSSSRGGPSWWPLGGGGSSNRGTTSGTTSGTSSSSSSGDEEGEWAEWRYLRPRSPLAATRPAQDISFELVEGDFQAFKGLWRIQQAGPSACRLSYSLFVRPQPWLLVGLIEQRIQGEIAANLAAVKGHVERVAASGGQQHGA